MEILRYIDAAGHDVVGEWLAQLRDARAAAKIATRIDRLEAGNFGDHRSLGGGIFELRIDWGPGYRVYFAMSGRTCIVLLGGGDKRRQNVDIEQAIANWADYQRRASKS